MQGYSTNYNKSGISDKMLYVNSNSPIHPQIQNNPGLILPIKEGLINPN